MRASKAGQDHTITIDYLFHKAMTTPFCPLTGARLEYERGGDGSPTGGTANSPTVDRIDPNKGYVPGNIWIVSKRANSIKARQTVEYAFQRVAQLEAA